MIKFENVSFAYKNGRNILSNISLSISEGEKIALVGANGSGKTTLALLINGVLKANSGTVSVDGLNPADQEDSNKLKRKVGLVFQNPDNQLVSTTVETESAFSLENANCDILTMQSKVDLILEYFDLAKLKTELTSNLSGGEKQKLALASVMIAEPDILILDEPGSYLDESGKRLLDMAIDKLIKIKPNLTIIRITQYAMIAEKYPRIVICREGSIIADGPPEQIFRMNPEDIGIGVPIPYQLINGYSSIKDDTNNIKERRLKSNSIKTIKAESISFDYHNSDKPAIFDNQGLEIKSNKVYGLVGRSGSGKTTLLQLMSGLLKPLSGKIEKTNFDANDLISILFQQPEKQFFKETVDEEVRFGPENLQLKGIDSIVNNSCRQAGLDYEKYSHRNSFTLSGGEKRRLAFASVVSLNPAFIFFDEPTCALDNDGIMRFTEMIKTLKSNGIGIMIVSHFGDIIYELADEIILIDDGKICSPVPKNEFFLNQKYSDYLSTPEAVSYQLEKFGELKYYTKHELLESVK